MPLRDAAVTEQVFNHIALPPRLPNHSDPSVQDVNKEIINLAINAANLMHYLPSREDREIWIRVKRSLELCHSTHQDGRVDRNGLKDGFNEVLRGGGLIVHIDKQNSGILIRPVTRKHGSEVTFECFEASPTAANVLACTGALLCDYPGNAVSIPASVLNDPPFQETLTTFLEQASEETIEKFAAKAKKAGASLNEPRDTPAPHLITQILIPLLRTHGSPTSPLILRKRIKDDVCWNHAYLPWRRSPFYLVVRVCVQRLLYWLCGSRIGRMQYKLFICMIHCNLLQETAEVLPLESRHFLLVKLCRRLAKLEVERQKAENATLNDLFDYFAPYFSVHTNQAAQELENQWVAYRSSIKREIPTLPLQAEKGHTRLLLSNSGVELQKILSTPLKEYPSSSKPPIENLDAYINPHYRDLFDLYRSLDMLEKELRGKSAGLATIDEAHCLQLARNIGLYLDRVNHLFDICLQEKSVVILFLFELWIDLDKCMVHKFPMLRQYGCGFLPDILDVLQLTWHSDMERLADIEEYLAHRQEESHFKRLTLFSDPVADGFADRYVRCSPDSKRLMKLCRKIEAASLAARKTKEAELERVNKEYSQLSHTMASLPCTRKPREPWTVCKHCSAKRKRRTLSISTHEDFLPAGTTERSAVQQRAVLFEIAMPASMAAYRDVTWRIISTYGLRSNNTGAKAFPARAFLHSSPSLKPYIQHHKQKFLLASRTKLFARSHYKSTALPVSTKQVLLPFPLDLAYYDSFTQRWALGQPLNANFAHHFTIDTSVVQMLGLPDPLEVVSVGASRSSYEIMTRQEDCPPNITVHEYIAYQGLLSSEGSRWLTLLRELGSSNINFTSEASMHAVNYLALRVGPKHGGGTLRSAHRVFEDPQFCSKLATLIRGLLFRISSNWREGYCMEMLLTLALRVWNLGSRQLGNDLLLHARRITSKWMKQLRIEVGKAITSEATEQMSNYALLAALLCKRTFTTSQQAILDPESLDEFFSACLTIQDYIREPLKLAPSVQGMLVRDLRMTLLLEERIYRSTTESSSSLSSAIETAWPSVGTEMRIFSPWIPVVGQRGWIECEVVGDISHTQRVHYHPLKGQLLVDFKPIQKLPSEIQESSTVKELFGPRHLMVFPSTLGGMSYTLRSAVNRHQIHFGVLDGEVVVLARSHGDTLRLIKRQCFGIGQDRDLPRPLVDDCVHWLNLKTGEIDIRRRKHMWVKNRPGNWVLNVYSCEVKRRGTHLVEPRSGLGQMVAKIFSGFEDLDKLLITQPMKSNITVELKQMGLDFMVNNNGVLVCRQLHADIDPDQDAGTWYGLQSTIVLRDSLNHFQRSIITPIGVLRWNLSGPHVLTSVINDGRYGHFQIDSVLGRVKCEPEPLLMYSKCLFHAITSSPLPDRLTGRTGTSEALACLTSAMSQPWSTLGPSQVQPLMTLAQLTPVRSYYPEFLKRQQVTIWDDYLTFTIQNDQYRPLVQRMANRLERAMEISRSDRLTIRVDAGGASHLTQRASLRRQNFNQSGPWSGNCTGKDDIYQGRDKAISNRETSSIREMTQIIRSSQLSSPATSSLESLFDQAEFVTGYTHAFQWGSLSDSLNVNIIRDWGRLIQLAREYDRRRYDILFVLGTIAFANPVEMPLLRVLATFCFQPEIRNMVLPVHSAYFSFRLDERPSQTSLEILLQHRSGGVSEKSLEKARKEHKVSESTTLTDYAELFKEECAVIAAETWKQWPSGTFALPPRHMVTIDVTEAVDWITTEWLRISHNLDFQKSLQDIQVALSKQSTKVSHFPLHTTDGHWNFYPVPQYSRNVPSIITLLQKDRSNMQCGEFQQPGSTSHVTWQVHKDKKSGNHSREPWYELGELKSILQRVTTTGSQIRADYGNDLLRSLASLQHTQAKTARVVFSPVAAVERIAEAEQRVNTQFAAIHSSLSTSDIQHKWLSIAHLWPCITPMTLLQQLRSVNKTVFGWNMRQAIAVYGISLAQLQQLYRIRDAVNKGDTQRLQNEHDNPGHTNWSPLEFPDWLLLELDADLLIRPVQVDVAQAMIAPPSGYNSALQMNMGEGKTSVVTPMVLSALANGKSLVRLIVPRSLLLQTAQTIQSRLGDLVGREVLHIPFSRKSSTDPASICEYKEFHEDMLHRSGIILPLPEHILSFKLSGFQCLADSKFESANTIVSTGLWLNKVCRDVIDECDFSLAVKTQLIYPSGSQSLVDGHPNRWQIAHTLLDLIDNCLLDVQRTFPKSIEVVRRTNGGFPFIHILRQDVEEALKERLVKAVCHETSTIFSFTGRFDQQAVSCFVSHIIVEESVTKVVLETFRHHPMILDAIYLLRGLIGHGILLMCLKKRWNVQYGLHPTRDPIAVPFQAKGVPSEQAEWGHPDVAIILTYLAFYYDGISTAQLQQCLQSISQSGDPRGEYERWSSYSATIPEALKHWNLINVDDAPQVQEIWQHLRYVVPMINYFLDHCIFPVHAQQFSQRLQMSGWDLPLFSSSNKAADLNDQHTPATLTTGFSGTNDDRFMLPMTIRQNDLPMLSHTNAEVLSYLLQARNRPYVVTSHANGKRLSESEFVRNLYHMKIRLLIDAGAHILELSNRDLVRVWLEIDHRAPGAVYFDADSKAWVIDRNGKEVPLLASSFAHDLGECLVYIDESHIRGTDLKFPPWTRGALTISLGQTKDHTVQAAMRLRQLGTTQSVTFMASPEAHQSILDFQHKASDCALDSADVVSWLLEQTCRNQEQFQPLYLRQGYDFCQQTEAVLNYKDFLTNQGSRIALMEILMEQETPRLRELYSVKPTLHAALEPAPNHPHIRQFANALDQRRMQMKGQTTLCTLAFAEVEQERELMAQVHEIRQTQRPLRLPHYEYPGLHPAIEKFAVRGHLEAPGPYEPAFTAFLRTGPGRKYDIGGVQQSQLLVSREFTRTAAIESGKWLVDFLRPVHWVLWSPGTQTALVIIPEEAESLLPLLIAQAVPEAHLLIYSAPVTKSMWHFNLLDFYSVPALPQGHKFPDQLLIEIGILAGRLFFTYDEYRRTLEYLERNFTYRRGSIPSDFSTISNNWLGFLQEWLSKTRKGREFGQTPMGYLCRNQILVHTHPLFSDPPVGYFALDIQTSLDQDQDHDPRILETDNEDDSE